VQATGAGLLAVLGPQRTRLRDVDREEGRALLVYVGSPNADGTLRGGMFATGRIALAASALLLPALPASATEASGAEPRQKVEAWAVPGSSAITITGHGFGHGNGMSQYGALGAAQQGLTWQQINEFYYPGTTWGAVRGKVRVLITADTGRDVQVAAERGLKVNRVGRSRSWRLPSNTARKWRLIAKDRDTAVQWTRGGAWRTWKKVGGEAEFSAADGRLTLVLPGARVLHGERRDSGDPPRRVGHVADGDVP